MKLFNARTDIRREHAAIVEAIKTGDKKAAIKNLEENTR